MPIVHDTALVMAIAGSVRTNACTGWNQMLSPPTSLIVNIPADVAETHPPLSAFAMFAGDW